MINRIFTSLAKSSLAKQSSVLDEPTLFEELYEYFAKKYFTPEHGIYENIKVNYDPMVTPAMIVIAGFIAVMAGACVMIFTKRVLGRFVRRLIRNEAFSADSAKTAEEIDLGKSIWHRLFINRMVLAKAVRCREEDEFYKIEKDSDESKKDAYSVSINTPRKLRYKRNYKTDHFYVAEDKRHYASVKFDAKGTNPLMLPVLAVAYIAIAIIIIKIWPSLLGVLDAAAAAFKGN